MSSLYAAFVIVALPVWLLHWWLAERAVAQPGPEGEQERESSIRALYLTAALAAPLLFLISGCIETLLRVLNRTLGSTSTLDYDRAFWVQLSAIAVMLAIMVYHWRIRRRDVQAGSLQGASVWLPRLYVFAAAFVGATFLLFGVGDIIRVVDDVLFGPKPLFAVHHWWAEELSSAIARTVVGLAVWGFHWEWAQRSLRRVDWIGESERNSSLRWVYVYAIVFVSVLLTLQGVSSSLESIFRWALDAPHANQQFGWPRSILEPLLAAIPFALFWAYHRLVAIGTKPVGEQVPLAASVRRLYTYLVAFVGLAFTGVGAAYVLGIVIDLILGGSRHD